jgi:hypothetical protein
MKKIIIVLLLVQLLSACAKGLDSEQHIKSLPTVELKASVSIPVVWTPTVENEIPEVLVPTFTISPTFTLAPPPTLETSPTTSPPSPTPRPDRTPVNYLEKFITATPFYGSISPGTLFQVHPKCPFEFMYPSDWEVSFDPEYIDSDYCVLSFRPDHWLAYIEESYLDLPEYAGQIIYWETSSHGAGFGFSYEDGDWYVGGDGIDLGQRIPLINSGENYILRGEIYYRGYARETDAYAGLQDLLIFFVSNSKGQSMSMEASPYEVEDGLELILRTISFKEVEE